MVLVFMFGQVAVLVIFHDYRQCYILWFSWLNLMVVIVTLPLVEVWRMRVHISANISSFCTLIIPTVGTRSYAGAV